MKIIQLFIHEYGGNIQVQIVLLGRNIYGDVYGKCLDTPFLLPKQEMDKSGKHYKRLSSRNIGDISISIPHLKCGGCETGGELSLPSQLKNVISAFFRGKLPPAPLKWRPCPCCLIPSCLRMLNSRAIEVSGGSSDLG